MSQTIESMRRFRVFACPDGGHEARVLEEASFEAAAVAYAEAYALPLEREQEVAIVVHELGTGREHCFKIDLTSGDTIPCG